MCARVRVCVCDEKMLMRLQSTGLLTPRVAARGPTRVFVRACVCACVYVCVHVCMCVMRKY